MVQIHFCFLYVAFQKQIAERQIKLYINDTLALTCNKQVRISRSSATAIQWYRDQDNVYHIHYTFTDFCTHTHTKLIIYVEQTIKVNLAASY